MLTADHESSVWFVFVQDKALAALAIEDKKKQYTAAEKYLWSNIPVENYCFMTVPFSLSLSLSFR